MKKWWQDTSHTFVEILAERKNQQMLPVSHWKMRDRATDGGQKLKKKGTKTGAVLCWLERKIGSWEILPHFLVVKDA